MSRKSQNTVGLNVDLPTRRNLMPFNIIDCFLPWHRAEEKYPFAETYDPKVSIDTIVQ